MLLRVLSCGGSEEIVQPEDGGNSNGSDNTGNTVNKVERVVMSTIKSSEIKESNGKWIYRAPDGTRYYTFSERKYPHLYLIPG